MKRKCLYLIFDVSGSANLEKYTEVYNYYKRVYAYPEYEMKIIKHNTSAEFSSIQNVLNPKMIGGGTYVSSGLAEAISDIVVTNSVDNVVIVCGDGDNWSEDDIRVRNAIRFLTYNKVEIIMHKIGKTQFLKNIFKEVSKEFPIKYYESLDGQDIFGKEQCVPVNIYGVEHALNGKLYDFVSDTNDLKIGDMVICTTIKGESYGRIAQISKRKEEIKEIKKYKKIIGIVEGGKPNVWVFEK